MALRKKESVTNYHGATFDNAYVVPGNILINKRDKRIRIYLKSYKDLETKTDETKEDFMRAEVLYTANKKDEEIYKNEDGISVVFLSDTEFNELLASLDLFYTKLYEECKKERVKEIPDPENQDLKVSKSFYVINPNEYEDV